MCKFPQIVILIIDLKLNIKVKEILKYIEVL